jgi:hypothetical protein
MWHWDRLRICSKILILTFRRGDKARGDKAKGENIDTPEIEKDVAGIYRIAI